MKLNFSKLNYNFSKKPLLIGGKAMEYYGLRKAGADIDLIVTESDLIALVKMYPDRLKDLWGDLGVCPFEFEIWKTICGMDYDVLKEGAIEEENVLVISEEKLLLMKAVAIDIPKYMEDVKLLTKDMVGKRGFSVEELHKVNSKILSQISGVKFIQKSGA